MFLRVKQYRDRASAALLKLRNQCTEERRASASAHPFHHEQQATDQRRIQRHFAHVI